ncbi:Hypothetical protein, putative [Bodo saltans]|uniref:Uncharacterized protein n=1 Tax=Bodo saltans TaxID=75058 RepID=A0A0S4JFH7_BODSA|nr:Hypothetical protein, putative [Bodo saltans]|eukprot:CUG87907.1 Hypothetical protein, putative [Bodo saltans]
MTEESRPLRLVERLSREHQQNRLSSMTNDYLEGWVDESAIDTSDTASPLQRLDENALEQLFKNWCDIVEERQIRREEIVFIASKAFASAGEVEEDRETHMNSIREALRAQFEEQFRFLREKKELSAKVSKKAERFDSTISLADFVSVMWEPLISTGIFDDSGTRLRVARATSKARQIVAMLTTVELVRHC